MSLSSLRNPSAQYNPVNTLYVNSIVAPNISYTTLSLPSLPINSSAYIDANHTIQGIGPLTTGEVLVGVTGSTPIAGVLTAGSNAILSLPSISGGALTLGVDPNPTFASLSTPILSLPGITANTSAYIGANNRLQGIGPLTNGQLIVGSTGNTPVATSLIAGSNTIVTTGAGTLSVGVSATPTFTSLTTTGSIRATGLILNSGSLLTSYISQGSFTPSLQIGVSSVGITYSQQTGTYNRIGSQVTVSGAMTVTSAGGLTGAVTVLGLPFIPNAAAIAGCALLCTYTQFTFVPTMGPVLILKPTSTSFNMIQLNTNGTATACSQACFAPGTSSISFSGTYFILDSV